MYYTAHYDGGRSPIMDRDPVQPTAAEESSATEQPSVAASASSQPSATTLAYEKYRQAEEQGLREMTLEYLSQYEVSLDKSLPDPKPVIARQRAIIGSEGNLSVIVGEAKSKKSFLCTALVGDLLRIPPKEGDTGPKNGFNLRPVKTLWLDTEQSELHVRKIARRLAYLTQWHSEERIHPLVKLYALREEPPKERLKILRQAIDAYRPKLVVVDGIADLQHNTNDLEESERIVTELMALSSAYNCHILSVLHANPNSDKARGHLGSALQRKAETVLFVHRVGEQSVVEPQFCRNEPFDRFSFIIENPIDEGVPSACDLPSEEARNEVVTVLKELYGGCIEREVLTRKLAERIGSENTARVHITRAVKRGLVSYDPESKLVRVCSVQ